MGSPLEAPFCLRHHAAGTMQHGQLLLLQLGLVCRLSRCAFLDEGTCWGVLLVLACGRCQWQPLTATCCSRALSP